MRERDVSNNKRIIVEYCCYNVMFYVDTLYSEENDIMTTNKLQRFPKP